MLQAWTDHLIATVGQRGLELAQSELAVPVHGAAPVEVREHVLHLSVKLGVGHGAQAGRSGIVPILFHVEPEAGNTKSVSIPRTARF